VLVNKVSIPEPSGIYTEAWSLRKIVGLLKMFGPAAMVASLAIGAGETIVVVRSGAWAGYDLLWLITLSCIAKAYFVTYMIGRYTAISGEYIGHRLVKLPGPRGWLLLMIVMLEMVGAPLAWVPISKPCGDLFHYLLRDTLPASVPEHIWENLITSVFVGAALLMALRLTFDKLERQQLIICAILVFGTVTGTLLVRPDFFQTAYGAVNIGYLPEFPSWTPEDAVKHPALTMTTTFGYVGGSVMAYAVYANWVGIHKWGLAGHKYIDEIREHAFKTDEIDYLPDAPEEVGRLKRLAEPLRWDVSLGAIVLFFVTAGFMVSGAAVLYPLESRFEGWSLLTNQAHVWSNIHPSLVWVYYICILAALWGTLQALPEVYARVVQEFFQAVWPDREWDFRKLQRQICIYIFIASMTIIWLNIPFDILTQIAGFLLANFAIPLVMVAALYLNFKLPAAYRVGLPTLIGSVLSTGVLIGFGAISGWGLWGKLFGG
jgi:Mn2+/Fe2+ NRAMP family transporter